MVILIVHQLHIHTGKPEGDSPVAVHPNGPEAFQCAFERVQAEITLGPDFWPRFPAPISPSGPDFADLGSDFGPRFRLRFRLALRAAGMVRASHPLTPLLNVSASTGEDTRVRGLESDLQSRYRHA